MTMLLLPTSPVYVRPGVETYLYFDPATLEVVVLDDRVKEHPVLTKVRIYDQGFAVAVPNPLPCPPVDSDDAMVFPAVFAEYSVADVFLKVLEPETDPPKRIDVQRFNLATKSIVFNFKDEPKSSVECMLHDLLCLLHLKERNEPVKEYKRTAIDENDPYFEDVEEVRRVMKLKLSNVYTFDVNGALAHMRISSALETHLETPCGPQLQPWAKPEAGASIAIARNRFVVQPGTAVKMAIAGGLLVDSFKD